MMMSPGPGAGYRFNCMLCSRGFHQVHHYKAHLARVHQQTSLMQPCHLCRKVFSRSDHLKKHVKQVHKDAFEAEAAAEAAAAVVAAIQPGDVVAVDNSIMSGMLAVDQPPPPPPPQLPQDPLLGAGDSIPENLQLHANDQFTDNVAGNPQLQGNDQFTDAGNPQLHSANASTSQIS